MIPVETKPFQKINGTLVRATTIMLLSFVVYWGFYYYETTIRNNVVSLVAETSSLEQDQSEASQIKKQLSDIDARRSVLASYFVDQKNPVPFEEAIEGYGKTTNTKVLFDGLEVKTNPNRLDVAFNVSGTFSDT